MMYQKYLICLLLLMPFASQAAVKLNIEVGSTICSKATSGQLLKPYRYDPYSLGLSRHPLRAMIEPVGRYLKGGLAKRAVFTEDGLQAYADLLKTQDSYVFARYYNVSDEQAVRSKLFSLQVEKQQSMNTLIFAKDVIETLSPAKSLVDTVLSQLGKYQKQWSLGQKTLKQLGIEKITGNKQATFVSNLKTLIANGGQFYYLEGLSEPCTCDGFFIKRILYYRVSIGSGVRSAIIFAEKRPVYVQTAQKTVLFLESFCR